jgi:ATP-dependent Zn protease
LKPLESLKDALIKHETIEANEVTSALEGSKMPKEAALY